MSKPLGGNIGYCVRIKLFMISYESNYTTDSKGTRYDLINFLKLNNQINKLM